MLLVASVLASMRWLLCGGDSSKKEKTTSVISKKCPAREFISITVFINSKKLKTAPNYEFHGFIKFEKQLNLHHAFLQLFLPRSDQLLNSRNGSQ